jgi:phosphatidylserine decarboxylase
MNEPDRRDAGAAARDDAGDDAEAGRRRSPADRAVPDVTPDLPSHRWRLLLGMLRRLPQAALSRSFGQLADLRVPPRLRPMVLGGFARALGIDLDEAEKKLEDYDSINDLFVRRLRAGARNWPVDDAALTSPVDGVLGRGGTIVDGSLIQAKGRRYSAAALLDDDRLARRFADGCFLTIYLSPRHYHRIHAPAGGSIAEARHVPGALLPVNAAGVMHIDNLFPRNERVVCVIDGAMGHVAVVAVGAYNVGRISTAFDPGWIAADGRSLTNRGRNTAEHRTYEPPLRVARGDEIMAFHLGSTIVLLFEQGVSLDDDRDAGSEVRLGEIIARVS